MTPDIFRSREPSSNFLVLLCAKNLFKSGNATEFSFFLSYSALVLLRVPLLKRMKRWCGSGRPGKY